MHPHWEVAQDILDQSSITNRGQHTRKTERGIGTYAIRGASEYKIGDDLVAQELAQLITKIGLFPKQFAIMSSKKMNTVGA